MVVIIIILARFESRPIQAGPRRILWRRSSGAFTTPLTVTMEFTRGKKAGARFYLNFAGRGGDRRIINGDGILLIRPRNVPRMARL
jgi:hypothetical protein